MTQDPNTPKGEQNAAPQASGIPEQVSDSANPAGAAPLDWPEARRKALEEAAKVADSTVCDTHLPTGIRIYGQAAGRAIRALIDQPEETA